MKEDKRGGHFFCVVLAVLLIIASIYLGFNYYQEKKNFEQAGKFNVCIQKGMDNIYLETRNCRWLSSEDTCLDGITTPYSVKQNCINQTGWTGS